MYTEEKVMLSANVVDERPDFAQILDHFQRESIYSKENTEMLKKLANSVKPMEERPMNKEVESKSPNCLVDYLWQEIHRLQMSNQETHEAIRHLQRVIGN